MTDDSIIRVYRFLNSNYDSAENWQADADENYGNNNGVLTKNEFCNFMLDLDDLWVDGLGDTDNAKRDVINKFWATIDSNTGGNIKGKGCSNKNAVDLKELEQNQTIMDATQQIDQYVSDKYPPSVQGINIDTKSWKDSVSAGMLNSVINAIHNNEEYDIDYVYKTVSNKAIADYVALNTVPKLIEEQIGTLSGYKFGDDKVWASIIDKYIESINADTDVEQIISDVQEIAQAYVNTAIDNSDEDVQLLKQYGYNNKGVLNDLQYAVIGENVKNEFISLINSDDNYVKFQELYEAKPNEVDNVVNSYIKNLLKNEKNAKFSDNMNKIQEYATTVLESKELNTLLKRFTLNNDVNTQLANDYRKEIRTEAIQTIFGTIEPDDLEKLIDNYSEDVLDTKSTVFNRSMEIINKISDSFLTEMGLPDEITGFQGETEANTIINNTSGYPLTYKVIGDAPISISSAGKLALNTNKAGTWEVTVAAYSEDNVKVAYKTVKITIRPQLNINNVEPSWQDNAEHLEVFGEKYTCNADKQVTSYDFKDLYNNGAYIQLHIGMDKSGNWNKDLSTFKSRLSTLGEYIANALCAKSSDIDKTRLQAAVNTVVEEYISWGDINCKKNDKGKNANRLRQNLVNDQNTALHGVIHEFDSDGKDSDLYAVSFKSFVDDILKVYNGGTLTKPV